MKRLAIIGGTGRVGKKVIDQALAQGYHLNVLTRREITMSLDERITVVVGDAADPQALDQLLSGADAVISTLGPSGINDSLKKAKLAAKDRTSTNSTRAILPLMKKHNIDRFVLMTGPSLKHPEHRNNIFYRTLLTKIAPKMLGEMTLDRQQELELLLASEVNFTVALAGQLDDAPSNTPLRADHTRFQGFDISVPNLAEFLVDQVKDNRYWGKAVYVAN